MTISLVPTSPTSNRSFNGATGPASVVFNPKTSRRENVPPYLRGVVAQSSTTFGPNNPPGITPSLTSSAASNKNTSTAGKGNTGKLTLDNNGRGTGYVPPSNPGWGNPDNDPYSYVAGSLYTPPPRFGGPDNMPVPEPKPAPLPPGNPFQYEWNLPPHKWSLPLAHTVLNEDHYNKNKVPAPKPVNDTYRRGRIWWKANPDISVVKYDSNNTITTEKTTSGDVNRKYGFQFLWNPESFGTNVSVQLEATPTVQDRFLGVSGAFPGTEAISFTLRLDRTNDFACAATLLNDNNTGIIRRIKPLPTYSDSSMEAFEKFYRLDTSFQVGPRTGTIREKIGDLMRRGTLADLEYLYRAINGRGPGMSEKGREVEWVNGRGIKTADIGWLMPTLLHVDVGPLSYDGYVNALQVNHLAFTPEMIPIRTDVVISIQILATAGLSSNQPS